jgi:tripartite-type tricarboxylate transporter receptor subunit TctC
MELFRDAEPSKKINSKEEESPMKKEVRGGRMEWGRVSRRLPFLFLIFFVLALPSWAADKPYPENPVKVIMPWAVGSTGDLGGRTIADRMTEFFGQPLVFEHRPGAGAVLGVSFGAKAKPDGYTVVYASSSPLLLAPIVKKVDYKFDDFIHVRVFGKTVNWLAVRSDARWKTLKEFIDEEKKSPGKLKISSYGRQTPGEFVIDLVSKFEGIKLTLVPFKSGVDALPPLLGGHVDAAIVPGTGGMLDSGQIRMLAVAEENRLPDYPNIPTFTELGYPIVTPPGRYWYCFPKGTPKECVDKFSAAHEMAVKRYAKEITGSLKKLEMWAEFLSREETLIRLKKDAEMYSIVVRELGIGEK